MKDVRQAVNAYLGIGRNGAALFEDGDVARNEIASLDFLLAAIADGTVLLFLLPADTGVEEEDTDL